MNETDNAKAAVRAFWQREACGERYGADQDRIRYELEPHIDGFARFDSAAGRRVLEIGVGMGADFLRWARAGATVTGVDLTDRAVKLTQSRLAEAGLTGEVRVADAEALPFEDDCFDIVYSWGVIHHTPSPERALLEAVRVLVPGGSLRVMLYHRRSWVALGAWARFGLLRGRPWASLAEAVAHIESPGTKAFTANEVEAILGPHLSGLRAEPVLTHWDRRMAPGIARLAGARLGWFLLISGTKVAEPPVDRRSSGTPGLGA